MNQIIGNLIVRLNEVDSTNNYANQQIRDNGVAEGTVFLAYSQIAGRGQQKNTWESAPGQNLVFSIVLNPDFLEIRDQFMLSKIVSLGIYHSMNKYVDGLKVKWPNDIYVGNLKLGGVLIENSVMNGLIKYSVIGIGINVNQDAFFSNAPNPVSLKMLTKNHFDIDILLSEILSEIDKYYKLLKSGNFLSINLEFESVLFRLHEKHFYRTNNEIFEGEICGVNEIGQLIIKNNNDDFLEFHLKEVEFMFTENK
jgi:BirA family biotin operon repressor/biotin-[acetyl-CoA-carboxylase] ligase